jgi:hypothetical protein
VALEASASMHPADATGQDARLGKKHDVIPANAEAHIPTGGAAPKKRWIPAFAGMTLRVLRDNSLRRLDLANRAGSDAADELGEGKEFGDP